MSHTDTSSNRHGDLIPRAMIRLVAALVLSCLAIVTFARVTDRPPVATPPVGEVVHSRSVLLDGAMDGSATVHAPDGTLIADLSPEQGGFISGLWRVIRRTRLQSGVATEAPVTIDWHDTGRVSITDPETGWSADLMGFGADNARAVARLLAQ